MNIQLSGKTAIVTGSTQGIGLAIAHGLAGSGATVVINGRSEPAVGQAVAAVKAASPAAEVAWGRRGPGHGRRLRCPGERRADV